jgi:hypothetical protein
LLYNATPANATPGCIVVVIYTNSTENFLGIIKLDKNDAIAYEENTNGFYELVYKGNSLPLPNKRNKLLKFATIRDTDTITEQEWDLKPGLIVLDKQVENLAQFFYRTFLEAQFLLTDDHKSEKLVDGLNLFLNSSVKYNFDQKQEILRSFGNRLMSNEELTVEDAGLQILAKYHTEEELMHEVERLESLVLQAGMGDTNLRGVMTPKIEKQIFGIQKITTIEGVQISYPGELWGTQVEIKESETGEGQDIFIKGVHIRPQ